MKSFAARKWFIVSIPSVALAFLTKGLAINDAGKAAVASALYFAIGRRLIHGYFRATVARGWSIVPSPRQKSIPPNRFLAWLVSNDPESEPRFDGSFRIGIRPILLTMALIILLAEDINVWALTHESLGFWVLTIIFSVLLIDDLFLMTRGSKSS